MVAGEPRALRCAGVSAPPDDDRVTLWLVGNRCVTENGERGNGGAAGTAGQSAPVCGGAGQRAAGVGVEDVRRRGGDPAGRRQVQELVGAVRVRFGPEHARDDELGVGEPAAEHAHERDRAALAQRPWRLAERRPRGAVERPGQPGRLGRRVPSRLGRPPLDRHRRPVGRVGGEPPLDGVGGGDRVVRGRHPQRQLHRGRRAQDVARLGGRRGAVDADHLEGGAPGPGDELLLGGRPLGPGVAGERVPGREVAEVGRGGGDLPEALVGDVGVQLADQQLAGVLVLDAAEQRAQDAERRRHDAAGRARVHALGQHLDPQDHVDEAAERGGHPQAVPVAAPRVERDDERRFAEPVAEQVEVGRQVGAARFLAGLDQDDAAGVRAAAGAHRLERGQGGEGRVAVVGRAAPVEAVALDHGFPGAEARPPAVERRLLVEVAVQQDRVVGRPVAGRGHVDEQQRGASLDLLHLDLGAVEMLVDVALAPVAQQLGGPRHVPRLVPAAVVRHRHVRDADVVVQHRDDVLVPGSVGVRGGGGGVEGHAVDSTTWRGRTSAMAGMRLTRLYRGHVMRR